MKVLVVDDVGYSRHYHTRLLQKLGYQAEAVESGPAALKVLLSDMTIGAVLTDLMMAGMDGVELFKRSQRIERQVDGGIAVPPAFILMTALRPDKDVTQTKDLEKIRMAKDLGFADVLFKPITPETLKGTFETIRRGRVQIDTSGMVNRLRETITNLINEKQLEDSGRFLDDLRSEIERLDQFVSQPAES